MLRIILSCYVLFSYDKDLQVSKFPKIEYHYFTIFNKSMKILFSIFSSKEPTKES